MQNMEGVDPRLIRIAEEAIQITKIDFGIPHTGGLRTAEQQKILYDDGKSGCNGFTRKSKHQSGLALDFYAYVDGKASWDKYHLTHIAGAMLQSACKLGYKVSWGGFWTNFVDMPHIEIRDNI